MATNKTLKVVVRADLSQGSINELLQDIDTLQTKVNKKLEVTAHIKDIVIDDSALNAVKGKIQKIFNTVTVDINGNILGVGTGKAEGITSLEKYAKSIETRLQNIFNPRLFGDGSAIKKQFDELTKSIRGATIKSDLDTLSDQVFNFKKVIEGVYQPLSNLRSNIDSFKSKNILNLDAEQIQKINEIKNRIDAVFSRDISYTIDDKGLQANINEIKGIESSITELVNSMRKGSSTVSNFSNRMENLFTVLARVNSTMASHKGLGIEPEIESIKSYLNTLRELGTGEVGESYTNEFYKEVFGDINNITKIDVHKLREIFSAIDLKKLDDSLDMGSGKTNLIASTLTDLVNKLSIADSQIKQNATNMRRDNSMETYQKRLSMLSNELDTFYAKYSKISQNQGAAEEYRNLTKRIEALKENPNDADLTNLTTDIKSYQKAVKDAGLTTDTLGEKIQKAYQKFGGWALITTTMMKAVQYIRMMYQNVVLLDTAMTELKKVTDETQAGYDAFMNRAKNTAKEIGAALSDVITATADFSRLGYTMSEAEDLSKAALVYKQVGDGIEDVTTASETLITTMKAFGNQYGEAGDAMLIVDKLNEVLTCLSVQKCA